MPDRPKCSSWSSRLGVGHEANDPNPEKNYCYETVEEAKIHTVFIAPVKKRKKQKYVYKNYISDLLQSEE
jgi:hypothetical protein